MTVPLEALSPRINGKNILIFRAYAVAINHFAIEQAVCGQLGLMGAKVNWLICNGVVSECDRNWQLYNRNDKKDACSRCVGFAIHIRNQFKLDMAGLGDFLSDADYEYVDAWLDGLDASRYVEAELDGWALGLWAKSSVHTHLRCSEILLHDTVHASIYRAYLRSAALTAIAFKHYLASSKVDAVFIMNGRTAASRTVFEIARSLSIPVAVHEFGRSEETRSLYLNEICSSMKGWNRHWQTWKDIPLSPSEISTTQELLAARIKGALDYSFNKDNTLSIKDSLGSLRGKKIVSLFTSSTDEISSSEDWDWPFTQIEWMAEVVRYFRARQEYILVIRCHPNHDAPFLGRDSQFLDALPQIGYQGCDNIRVVMPNEKLNSYDLILASSAALVFSSTVAVESSLLGVKTMIAGSGRNQGRQVAYEYTDSLVNFESSLARFLNDPIDAQWRINAARWLYLYNYRYAYDVPLVMRTASRLECKPEAYTVLSQEWEFLDHIIRFFTEDGEFEQWTPPALADQNSREAEAAAVTTAFEQLAQQQMAVFSERGPSTMPRRGKIPGILILDLAGDASKLERTLKNVFAQADDAAVVVLSTSPPAHSAYSGRAELIYIQSDSYQDAMRKLKERASVRWTMLLHAGDSLEFDAK